MRKFPLGEWSPRSGPGARAYRAPQRLSGAHGGRARVGQAAGRRAAGVVRLGGAHGGRARRGQAAGRHIRGEWTVQRTSLRQVRRGDPRADQVQYHYPAERCSRRPSPRGAGGRTVRALCCPAEQGSRRPSPRGLGGRAAREGSLARERARSRQAGERARWGAAVRVRAGPARSGPVRPCMISRLGRYGPGQSVSGLGRSRPVRAAHGHLRGRVSEVPMVSVSEPFMFGAAVTVASATVWRLLPPAAGGQVALSRLFQSRSAGRPLLSFYDQGGSPGRLSFCFALSTPLEFLFRQCY